MNKSNRMQYEPMQAKTILNPVKAPSMPFDWSINPYRGCQHGCSFCYARSTHTFLGVEADDTFQRHIFLKENAPTVLREQIEKRLRSQRNTAQWGQVAIGTATDPYQQIESTSKLTRGCLEVLAEFNIPISITTRSPLIVRDLDLLKQFSVISVNMSISTLNNTIWRQFEPSTPSPAQRILTVDRLNAEGIPVGVFVAPILPLITDDELDLEELIAAVAEAGAHFIMPSFLRLSTSAVKVWFFQTLGQHYPHLIAKYAQLYQNAAHAPATFRIPIMQKIEALLLKYDIQAKTIAMASAKQSLLEKVNHSLGIEAPVQLTLF